MKVSIEGRKVVFTFDGAAPLVFERDRAADAQARIEAEMLGWSNKLRDMAALERKAKDGTVRTVTEQMRREAVAAGVDHFHNGGAWTVKRAAPQNPAIAALAQAKGISYVEAEAFIAQLAVEGMEGN